MSATRQRAPSRDLAPPARSRRQGERELQELQRTRIMAALLAVVLAEGSHRLTVAKIARRARVSRRTFHELFRDPEDCFLATFDTALSSAQELARSTYSSQPGWRQGMRAAVPALLALGEREPGLAKLCVVHALCAGERVLERRAQAVQRLARAIHTGRELTDTPPELALLGARTLAGGLLALVEEHLRRHQHAPLSDLHGPLISMIVMPYLGHAAACEELALAAAAPRCPPTLTGTSATSAPLARLEIRLTTRTLAVLAAVREHPGASNRELARLAGVHDTGQISKLLRRLERHRLLVNDNTARPRAPSNAWRLTALGAQLASLAGAC